MYICLKYCLNKRVKYWIDLADYDLATAEAMLQSGRDLYVGFMCHQTVEKLFKAYYCLKKDEIPPYSHNLNHLAGKSGILELIPDNFGEFINILEPLNIEARYPTQKELLLKSLTRSKCDEIFSETKQLHQWVKKIL